ncbi:hypothetical protein BH18VER1_BH18VER1_17960 [soil metagenome]
MGQWTCDLLRALSWQLIERGHYIVFFERDVSYHEHHRDLHEFRTVSWCFITNLEMWLLEYYGGCSPAAAVS